MKENEKKIGIAGYWFATNYGGVASYYSLYSKIEKLGYHPFLIESPYAEIDREGLDTFPRKFFESVNFEKTDCYNIDELSKLNERADTFVLGSDQVLTSSSIKAFGKLFLMEFANDEKKKIAISSSCGGDNLNADNDIVEYAKKQLNRFSDISVREYTAVDIVKNKFGIDADLVIDPIFFTSQEEYEQISNDVQVKVEEPYLLAYVLDPTPDKKSAILKIAKERKLKIKVVLDGRKFTHEQNLKKMEMPEETLPELNFNEWLYYFNHASYVFTDSFHGASMSIIMNKQFVMYANHMRGYPRFLTLAKMFEVHSRLVDNSENITDRVISEKINFEKINKVVHKQCEYGEAWLNYALGKKPKNNVNTLLDEQMCTGCSACVNACPVEAIQIKDDALGYYKSSVNSKKCINCNKCIKVCPAIQIPKKANNNIPECFAVVAKEQEVLEASSSGGVFTLLAREAFKKGGHIVGAAWKNDFSVQHIMINDVSELYKLQKSKYLQSYIGNILSEVKEKLEKGKFVLYSGCPCQIAGLKKYLGKEYDNLILVDILCANAPSAQFFQKYLKDSFPQGVSKYGFRHKQDGWSADCVTVTVTTKEGIDIIRRGEAQDSYQRVFHNHTMCAPHCEKCKYHSIPRYGDLTIGDFWGYSKHDSSIDTTKGISVVLCNNEKGEKFFDKIPQNVIAVKKEVPLEWLGGNGYAVRGKNYSSPYRDRFYEAIQKTSFSKAIEYAYSKRGLSDYPNALKNVPLQYNSAQLRFITDANIWEEHFINSITVLTTKQETPSFGYYACMPMMHTLVGGRKYRLSMRLKIKTASQILNLHIKESLTKKVQIIHTHTISSKDAYEWVNLSVVFVPNANVYNEFMIGAAHITGKERFIAIDYIDIREE